MRLRTAHFLICLLACSCSLLSRQAIAAPLSVLAEDAQRFYDIPRSAQQSILEAMPETASADPEQVRRLLVFNLHVKDGEVRPGHPSIPYGNFALYQMGKATGAYEVSFSENPEVFATENLAEFDAVFFNNTAGVLTENSQLRNDLLDYIFSGGGFLGLHAAAATFCQWPRYDYFPEYGEMLGGFEAGGHPWKPHEAFPLKIDDPRHPVAAAFDGRNPEISDEVFQFTAPYSRNRQRVLLSIDTAKTDMSPERRILPERQADGDLAMSWVKRYGRGRVFYTSLGHNKEIYSDPEMLQHYLDAIQFALGDLPAPTTPSQKLTPAIRAREQLGWKLGIAAYTYKDSTLFETIDHVDELGLAYIGGLNVQTVSDDIPKKFDHNLSDEEIRAVRRKLVSKGISMLTYFVFDIPGNEEGCRKIFEFGRKMGIETFLSEPKPEALDMIERYCEAYNIKLGLHNHGQRLSPMYMRPEGILEACEDRSPLIGAAVDFGYWVRSGIDPLEAVKTLGDRIITLQVHDQNESSAEAEDVSWGTGVVQLGEIFTYLREKQINPVMFGLEYSAGWDRPRPEIRQSIDYFDTVSLKLAE